MKFLVDESVEYRVVLFLREINFDTISVAEEHTGLKDSDILSLAYDEDRIIITNDKDFGELIFKLKLPHKGVILIRLDNEDSQSKIDILKSLFKNYKDKLKNTFVVVKEKKVRFTKTKLHAG